MALTRAQLLAGDGGQGYVLPGQVQGVSQGAGVLIASNGQISVDASTVTGLVKLNNLNAFNGYVWPDVKGANGTFLTIDAAGFLSWKSPAGFAVVTVSNIQPSPSDVGELWYDCRTGYLKVFQNCVDPQGWTNVAQPGLPVDPLNTGAVPAFVRGLGTVADPYECVVATVASGSSLFIVNSVTVTNLAPYQYVPIVDLNAFTNGGRFHFTNNVADASGVLKFQTVFIDQPPSLSGTNYTALIQVGYSTAYIEAFVDVINPIILLSPGSISGQPKVNAFLSYTQGTATGGLAPLNYTWVWEDDLGNILQTGGNAYQVQPGDLGRDIFVRLTVQDSATPPSSVSGTTNIIGPIVYNPIPSTDWNPTPTDGMDYIPGGQSGTYTGPGLSATSTGCVLLSVNGAPYDQGPQALTTGDTLAIKWDMSSTCGGAPSGTILTGTLSDGLNTNEYTVTVDRLPTSFGFNVLSDVQPNSQHSSSTASITGINTTAYVTLAATNTAPTPVEISKDGGSTWAVVPSAPNTTAPFVNNGDNIQLRFTTGATLGQLYTAVINIGDGDNVKFTSSSPGFRVTNAVNPIFPNTVFDHPGGPNAAPVTVNLPLQNLYGKATATWADGNQNLTATGALLFQVNGSGYAQTSVPIINGDTIDICWDLTQVNAAANGATLTGSFTNGLNANTYNLVIDRNTDGYDFTNLSNQLLNTPVVSNTVNPVGFNVPVQLTYAAGTPDTLTSVLANIGATTFVAVPTSGTGLYVNPGQNIQMKATTGINYTTPYSITTTLGAGASATDVWTVTTGSTAPLVVTPSIASPNNGATGVATTVNVSGTAYINQNGAGPQASSDWQIYQAIPVQPKSSPITNVQAGPGIYQAPYSSRFPIQTSKAGVGVGAPTFYSDWWPVTPTTGSPLYAFDGLTTTIYSGSTQLTRNVLGPPAPADLYQGWVPTVGIPFTTSVEIFGQGSVRLIVDGVAGPTINLNTGIWNVVRIGSGTLNSIEWKNSITSQPVPIPGTGIWYNQFVTYDLSAVRIDGQILKDSDLGQLPYSERLQTFGWAQNPQSSVGTYTVTQTSGSPLYAFDGLTSTTYDSTIRLYNLQPAPAAPTPTYMGWSPTVPIPFTSSVEVWGSGTIRTVVNGVAGAPLTLTPGLWNTINIGSGNLESIQWQGNVTSSPVPIPGTGFRYSENLTVSLVGVRVDGQILKDSDLGQGQYSQRWPIGSKLGLGQYDTGLTSGSTLYAFDGLTTTVYDVSTQLYSNLQVPAPGLPAPPIEYMGWSPTIPIPFGTSIEVYGSGTVRTVVNGTPGPDITLTPSTWNIVNIGSGVLNSLQWKGNLTSAPAPIPSTATNYSQSVTFGLSAIRIDGVILTDVGSQPSTLLTFQNNTNFSSFAPGDSVVEINSGGGAGDAAGTIAAVNSGTSQITVSTSAGAWTVGSFLQDLTAAPADPGPPTTSPPNPLIYTQIVNVTGDTVNLTSYPLSGLANSNIFYARVQYTSSTIVTNSGFSGWSKFTTV